MSRKRKLMELREEIKLKSSRKENNCEDIDECNLQTPFSVEVPSLPSISPPPFSPLTPLALQTKFKEQKTCSTELLRTNSPPLGFSSFLNNNDPASSPLQPMSPETQQLYKDLTVEELYRRNSTDIIENSDNDADITDDSLNDPDYVVDKPKQRIVFESEPENNSTSDIEHDDLEHNIVVTEKSNPKPVFKDTNTQLELPQQATTSKTDTNLGLHRDVASSVYENAQEAESHNGTYEIDAAPDQTQDISLSTVVQCNIEEQDTTSLTSTTDINNEDSILTERPKCC
ncbi:uncharacterized protein LOC125229139 [Leguminivora glycinivorella]|uniref:uncharacterized protein LOC125229139 n=1 Tax=Leguminivora glycinivorella TaxID=1035111 RepID=UPI00200F5876|nr:uncharacterized protein LOC125229139 [Leguminivora glycinivorella]